MLVFYGKGPPGKIQPLASKFISGSLMRTTSQRNETPYVTKTKVLSVWSHQIPTVEVVKMFFSHFFIYYINFGLKLPQLERFIA